MNTEFQCADCGETKPVKHDGGTGYAIVREDGSEKHICYQCCGKRDAKAMVEDGKACLYLSKRDDGAWAVSNWPGTLVFKTHYTRETRRGFSGKGRDAWFTGPDGKAWYGINMGDSQICRCRRLKA